MFPMDKVPKFGTMAPSTQVSGSTASNRVKVNSNGKIIAHSLAISKTISFMAKADTFGPTVIFMKELGSRMKNMGKEL